MRLVLFAVVLVALLGACKNDDHAFPTAVMWMDWPAEVNAQTSIPVRIVVIPPCVWEAFRAGRSTNQSTVTFEPFFLGVREDVLCAARASAITTLVAGGLDTTIAAPGLASTSTRTYDMRAAALTNTRVLGEWPVRPFGEIVVRAAGADGSKRNAAGVVYREIDTDGCVRVHPVGAYRPGTSLVLENQSDTANLSGAFLSGYIYDAPAPICGETRVFHLVSRN